MIVKLSILLSILNAVDAVLTKVGIDRGIVYELNGEVVRLHSQGLLLPVKLLLSVVILGLGLVFYYLLVRYPQLKERKSVLVLEAVATVTLVILVGAYAFAVLNNTALLAHHWIWGSR